MAALPLRLLAAPRSGRRLSGRAARALLTLAGLSTAATGQDLDAIRRAAAFGVEELGATETRWRARLAEATDSDASWRELFGYDPPGAALQLAILHAFLHEKEARAADATSAAALLRRVAEYREEVPAALATGRVEYAGGLPAVPNFFQLADYAEAWRRVKTNPAIGDATRRIVEEALAGSAEFVFTFPEWGPHNRAMLRAHGLVECALALPGHPRAPAWRAMAEVLAHDSLEEWEIEDASLYHPIWLLALFEYAEAAGREDVETSVKARWYLRYFLDLLGPDGTVPEFGDAWTRSSLSRYLLLFEWGAARLGDAELKWAAGQVRRAWGPDDPARPSVGRAVLATRLDGRVQADLAPREPPARSGCLDELLGKKVVIRSGRGPDDSYLLLNFRDEGDGGRLFRDYLRTTLAVRHEKMHHGHADENALLLWMDGGSVLLHDAGYRDVAPSGPHGEWRADLFHDRLVVRDGRPAPDEPLVEFLRDDGHYRPVRTEKIDFVAFDDVTYSRTRVADAARGTTWDRILLVPRAARMVVVVDTVAVDRPQELTLATLFATQELLVEGDGFALGRTRALGGRTLPDRRRLLVKVPAGATLGSFPLVRHRQEERVLHRHVSRAFAAGDRVTLVTALLSVGADEDPATSAATVTVSDDGLASIRLGDERLDLLVKLDLDRGRLDEDVRPQWDAVAATVRAAGVATDADFAFVVRGGARPRWGAVDMTHVEVDGDVVFEARPFQVFQTSGRSDRVGRSRWRRWEGALSR